MRMASRAVSGGSLISQPGELPQNKVKDEHQLVIIGKPAKAIPETLW